jgi:hypothetical protein
LPRGEISGAAPAPRPAATRPGDPNDHLPNFSDGTVGLLGPFLWARSLDFGEDARFSDSDARADDNGSFLWCHQFTRLSRHPKLPPLVFGRNNFTSRDPNIAFRVQPSRYLLNTTQPHNHKVIIGYMRTSWRFTNGDNRDLAHLAGGDRVCLFFPVRGGHNGRRNDANLYVVNTEHAAQPISIVEFAAGDMISYDWFRNPPNLDRHVLLDLAGRFTDANTLRPGITKPILQFDIHAGGRWTLRIETDGRDGLAGGRRDGGWDLEFTEKSPGARPYTVDVSPADTAWTLSTFSPGGRPADTSEVLLGLQPYDRRGGGDLPWPDRSPRIRNVELDKAAHRLVAETKPKPRK